MADFPAMPLWTDAYLADTRHLSQAEHGAYLLLMMEAWRRARCCLPDNDELLARLSGSPSVDVWLTLKPSVMALWTLDGRTCEWTQKRMLKERDFVEKSRRQKRKAAIKRWTKTKSDDAAASEPHVQPTPTPTPIKESPNGDWHNKPQAALSSPPKPKPQRGTRLPDDWQPSEADVSYARSKGFGQAAIDFQAERFRNFWHSKAGKDGVKLKWDATWRNWLLSEIERNGAPKRAAQIRDPNAFGVYGPAQ